MGHHDNTRCNIVTSFLFILGGLTTKKVDIFYNL